MTAFDEFMSRRRGGIDDLEGFDPQVALNAGTSPATVASWKRVHKAYFGATRFTQQQRVALVKARGNTVGLDVLGLIEKLIAHIVDEGQRWRLRHQLLELRGRYAAIRDKGKEIVPDKEASAPRPGVWCSSASRQGFRRLLMVAPERDIADIDHHLRDGLDPERPEAPQMLEKFLGLIRGEPAEQNNSTAHGSGDRAPGDGGPGDTTTSRGVPRGVYRPIVVVPVSALYQVSRGAADPKEITLTAADGTSVALAELILDQFGDVLEVAALHETEGPLQLYRGKRHANADQRSLVTVAHPQCVWVGCTRPADTCQVHHITAWKHGGETNLDNLVPLCRYHNAVNDDDPGQRINGRVDTIQGLSRWTSPYGNEVITTPAHSAMRLLFGRPPDGGGRR